MIPQVIYPYLRKRDNMVIAGSVCLQPNSSGPIGNWQF